MSSPEHNMHFVNNKYRSDIDGLRAVAILSVVGFHAFPEWVKGGFIGVDIFFVISGFLISSIIYESMDDNSFSLFDFYARRIRRIFPALLLVLTWCLVFGWFALLADEYKQLGKHVAGGAGFISNFVYLNESGYFDNMAETKPLLHLWSLGIEEQFYIFWPLLLWLVWRVKNANFDTEVVGLNTKVFRVAICIGLISFILNVEQVTTSSIDAFYLPQTRFWELMSGSVLAYLTIYKTSILPEFKLAPLKWWCFQSEQKYEKLISNLKSAFGVLLIIAGVVFITKGKEFPGWWAVLPTFGAIFIIAAGSNAWINQAVLSSRVLIWFGLISYPLYLWHWPLLSFAHILENGTPSGVIRTALIFISIVLAWLTYNFLEKTIRFGNFRQLKTAILFLLMAVVGAVGYNTYKQEGLKFRKVVLDNPEPNQNIRIASNPPSRCTDGNKYALANQFCTKFEAANSKKTIFIWGDSSALAWLPVFQDIAKDKGYTLINISHPSCPPILKARKTRFDYPASRNYCADGKLQDEVIELIKNTKPNFVIVIAAWNFYSPFSNREFITDEINQEANSITTQLTISKHLPETIKEIEKNSELIVFKSWPLLPAEPNYQIKRISFLQRNLNETVVDAKDFINDNRYINSVFDNITRVNTVFYNPSEKVCSDKCVSIFNGIRLYHDAYHITPQGAMLFRNEIEKLL